MIEPALARALAALDRALSTEAEWSPAALAIARALADEHATAAARGDGELAGLARAVDVFRLTASERMILVAALAPELDARYGVLFAILQHDGEARRPTAGLVARWLARAGATTAETAAVLGPDGHLVRSGLLELGDAGARAGRAIRIPEAWWPRLVGEPGVGPFAVTTLPPRPLAALVLAPATRANAEAAVAWARHRPPAGALIAIEGAAGSGRDALASALAAALGFASIAIAPAQLDTAGIRALVREAAWHVAAVIVHAGDLGAHAATLAAICREVSTPVIVALAAGALHELPESIERSTVGVEVAPLELAERAALWTALLGDRVCELSPLELARRFRFGPGRTRAVLRAATTWSDARDGGALRGTDIQRASRTTAGATGGLATRLDCPYGDDDIVLTPETRRELALVLAWARHGGSAFGAGGSGERIRGQHGLVCLFVGPPGTGKTMAAQLLARKLHLDVLRVDLSQVVDKYIGETEKNLERVFAEAEATGALLFFDEADALFGKRTEIKDAHDRYANLDTAFLLQRVERHPGIVVLATNLRANLDAAVFRRIHIVAEFAMPTMQDRIGIWTRHLVPAHLSPDVDVPQLAARGVLAGGDIRNAAITAALLAADDGGPIAMRHLVIGAWRELRKLGRLVKPSDFGPWGDDIAAYAGPSVETGIGLHA